MERCFSMPFRLDSAVEGEAQDKAQAFCSERNGPVPLSALAGIGAMSGPQPLRTKCQVTKKLGNITGLCVRCSRLAPRLAQAIQLNCGIRIQPGSRSCGRQTREAEPFRSEVDGFLPLSRHQSPVLGENAKAHGNDVSEHKVTLQLHSRTPSLLQGSASLSANSV